MTLESQLQIEYQKVSYTLKVKSIQMRDSWYFFVNDIGGGKSLLNGETLEMIYAKSFDAAKIAVVAKPTNTPPKVLALVKEKLLEDREWWYN